ncbi:pca operon transcription factor PcaQ [Oryzicola mucosus]|uniref:Pca operon transcription factor PcaQ n=1 Tax=Oryzicola mucosus TaxID=2767425 RepID=A0A8J6PTY6_9HYPH|nr:pca operon transcription factor PcaQ [Oryzicola mucosus]MBD0415499.1 pca operon transcription factor PcaQ [Oryzicola mucosus]
MVDQRIKLRHLRTFLAVARQKSVNRAASQLNISQPAVTKTIRELEELLGAVLFERDGRGIRITPQGEAFLGHAGMALSAVRQGLDAISAADAAPAVPLRVGALPTVSARIMPAAMRHFISGGPRSRIKIVTGENAVLLDQLRLGELDLVVGRLAAPEKMTGFFFEHLYSERVVFAVRTGHPLLEAGEGLFERIGAFPVLMPTRGSIIRPFVDRFFMANGMPAIQTEIETVSDGFGRAFLRDSDAVWVISEGVIARDIEDGALATLPIDTGDTKGPVGLTMRTQMEKPPGFERLLASVRRAADDLMSSEDGPMPGAV